VTIRRIRSRNERAPSNRPGISYASAHAFTSGLTAALPIGAIVLGVGALIALAVPGIRASRVQGQSESDVAEGVVAA
jgi:hypothetical protein